MVTANVSYPDFSAGELSPKMYGRFDLAAFYNGGRRVENFITEVGGMASYRTGTIYAAKTKDNNLAFMHTFTFSDAISFALEFTDLALRFYTNNGQVRETSQGITNVTQANPAVLTYSGADNYANGDSVFIEDVVGMTELNGNEYTVANVNVGANTFELSGVDSTAFTAYSTGGTVAVITELVTPFAEADLFELKFAQAGADMYIAHPSYNPQKLTYTTATSWAIANHSPTALTLTADNRPSGVGFYEQRLIYAGSNNNPNTIWFSKAGNFNNFTTGAGVTDGITYTIAGGLNKTAWLAGTNTFLAIGGFADVYQATGGQEEVITVDSISIKPTNSFGVADMMPVSRGSQIMYMQGNGLILRSFEYDLQTNSYTPIDRNTIADHITSSGITQIAYQEGRPNVLWAVKNNGVLVGMTIENSEAISGWHRHTTDGLVISVTTTARVNDYDQLWQCVKRTIEGVDTYYIEYYSDTVNYPRREDFLTDNQTTDETMYKNLLFESQKTYIHLDSSLSYYGDDLGLDAGVTLTPDATTGTGIDFTASGAIFTSAMVGRELWRDSEDGTQTGRAEITAFTSTTVVVCTIIEDFDSTDAIPAGGWYLTAGTFTGLDHLEGETVSVVADGGQHSQQTVSDGNIVLDRQASVVHVGLPYTGYLETNDLEGGGTTGTAQTKKKNVHAVGFRFLDTLYARYGTSYYKLEQIEMRSANMAMDRPPLMFTGDTKEHYSNESADARDGGWSREKRVIVSQDQPYPCNVQLIVPYMTVSN
jgi:hypothetical protein